MAKAVKSSVKKEIKTYVEEDQFSLLLSAGEAEVLTRLLAHVGGDPRDTARSLVDDIRRALIDSGAKNYRFDKVPHWLVVSGGLYFENSIEVPYEA